MAARTAARSRVMPLAKEARRLVAASVIHGSRSLATLVRDARLAGAGARHVRTARPDRTLAWARGRPQRRGHLCSLFWELPDDPRASLRWSPHKLRRVINTADREQLVTDRRSVLLDLATIDLDFQNVGSLRSAGLGKFDTTQAPSSSPANCRSTGGMRSSGIR
jgi:hypothetical protein